MGLQESLAKLREKLGDAPHAYRPSILSFLQLNVQKIARELKLAERGMERGQKDEPPADSIVFDNVEHEVIELAEGELKKAQAAISDDLSTYAQRLHSLDLEGRFATIEAAAMNGISSFHSETSKGLDRLELAARPLRELECELRQFKASNRLSRTAHYPSRAGKILRWGVIALLLLGEVIGNSYFLAKGSAYGLIGGFSEAVIIAFLNIGASMAIGHFGFRQSWHRTPWRGLVGLLSLAAWAAFAVTFNLFVSHYREAASGFLEGGGQVALQTLRANPFGLTEFQSWVLFGIGALFAFIAFVDALSMDDLYPFYGALQRKLEAIRVEYVAERESLVEELEAHRADTILAMQDAKADLAKRRGEHGAILDARARVQRFYHQHVAYLERAGNTLLSIYREANREARSSNYPTHFKEVWKAPEPPIEAGPPPNVLSQEKLNQEVASAQKSLDTRMREVHAEYEAAFRAYKNLAELAWGGDG